MSSRAICILAVTIALSFFSCITAAVYITATVTISAFENGLCQAPTPGSSMLRWVQCAPEGD